MNESIYKHERENDLPDPPDNVEAWEQLPESFRETVAARFETGIENEWQLNLQRVDRENNARDLRNARRGGRQNRASSSASEAA